MKEKLGTKKIAKLGLLLALAIILNWLEGFIIIPTAPPGIKLGLSNIVTMYALFFMDFQSAIIIAVLKGLFVLVTRGFTAGILSTCGGVTAVIFMLIAVKAIPTKTDYILISITGAVAHNMAQLICAAVIINSFKTLYLFPILFISGTVMGIITGMTVKTVLPHIKSGMH